jgi:hypothetical protein
VEVAAGLLVPVVQTHAAVLGLPEQRGLWTWNTNKQLLVVFVTHCLTRAQHKKGIYRKVRPSNLIGQGAFHEVDVEYNSTGAFSYAYIPPLYRVC